MSSIELFIMIAGLLAISYFSTVCGGVKLFFDSLIFMISLFTVKDVFKKSDQSKLQYIIEIFMLVFYYLVICVFILALYGFSNDKGVIMLSGWSMCMQVLTAFTLLYSILQKYSIKRKIDKTKEKKVNKDKGINGNDKASEQEKDTL